MAIMADDVIDKKPLQRLKAAFSQETVDLVIGRSRPGEVLVTSLRNEHYKPLAGTSEQNAIGVR